MNNVVCLKIRMNSKARTAWNFILQKGFYLTGQAGMSVRQFLVETLGFDNCLIDKEVRTIFLNSSPVDDIDGAYVKDGDRLALGSAMPGLVGICMGRDNPYKEFRSDIACQNGEGGEQSGEPVRVFMKIFSTLAVDTGADVLKRGIEINAGQLAEFLERQKAHVVDAGEADAVTNPDADVLVVVEFIS